MGDPFFESREWLELRYRALDGAKALCSCCGQKGTPANPLQVDHIKPRSKYPELALTPGNLQVLCRQCNLGKGNKSETDWRYVPSSTIEIQNSAPPEIRYRLQQLNWLALSGDTKQIRAAAHAEYRKIWRGLERDYIKGRQK